MTIHPESRRVISWAQWIPTPNPKRKTTSTKTRSVMEARRREMITSSSLLIKLLMMQGN